MRHLVTPASRTPKTAKRRLHRQLAHIYIQLPHPTAKTPPLHHVTHSPPPATPGASCCLRTPEQRRRFRQAATAFVDDLRTGRFRAGPRVKGVRSAPGVFELTWAGNGRVALFMSCDSGCSAF